MNKQKIRALVNSLLNSAKHRGTNQGVIVYTKALEMLQSATTDQEVEEIGETQPFPGWN